MRRISFFLALIGALLLGALPQTCRAQPVTVTVDWSKSVGAPTTRCSYGLNLYKGTDEKSAESAAYCANLLYMNPGIVRIHNAGKMQDSAKSGEGIVDEKNRTWDRAKIKRIFALSLVQKPEIVFNIPGWPAWMDTDKDGFLDKDQFDHYAAMMADLVRIVNVENKRSVRYWEITNELDGRYFTDFHTEGGYGPLKDPAKPDRWDEVVTIYNRCAAAMKRVDPTIRTGGPAAARSDLHTMHERFIRGALPNLDFFSTHAYASGSANDTDAAVYDKAALMGRYAREIVEMLARLSPEKKIPVMLGEYNISWTWETRDPRMTNGKSAVFDALVMTATAEAGVFSAQAWNEKDGIYGKTDGDDHRRPGADALHLFNRYLVGRRAAVVSGDTKAVVAAAIVDTAAGKRALLLVNRTGSAQTVEAILSGGAPLPKMFESHRITDSGLVSTSATFAESGGRKRLLLPPDSVTVLVF